MHERRKIAAILGVLGAVLALNPLCFSAGKKPHVVLLGGVRKVPYSKAGDPAGALPGEETLKVRALLVDGAVKEWTTGESHDVTERSFVVRRALRINDSLPGDKSDTTAHSSHWVWQRGPWLLVDRTTGHVSALKMPDYDPGVSQVSWFRDYGAYCGVSSSGKSLYAVVAQLTVRKPLLAKKLAALDSDRDPQQAPVCPEPEWQRDPLRVTFRIGSRDPVSFPIMPGSTVLVEDSAEDAEPSKSN